MTVVENGSIMRGARPENLSGAGVEAQDFQRVPAIGALGRGVRVGLAGSQMVWGLLARNHVTFDIARHEYPVTPHDRGRVPSTLDECFPKNALAPFER